MSHGWVTKGPKKCQVLFEWPHHNSYLTVLRFSYTILKRISNIVEFLLSFESSYSFRSEKSQSVDVKKPASVPSRELVSDVNLKHFFTPIFVAYFLDIYSKSSFGSQMFVFRLVFPTETCNLKHLSEILKNSKLIMNHRKLWRQRR